VQQEPHAFNGAQKVYLWLATIFIASLLVADIVGIKLFRIPLPFTLFGFDAIEHTCGMLTFPVTFLLTDLEMLGGTSIGYEFDRGNKLATAGIIPLGEGALMIMGGNMTAPPLATGEEVLAWDLERILLLNVPWWSGHFQHVAEKADGWVIRGSIDMPLSGSGFVACGLFSISDSFSAVKVERVAVEAVR